MTKKLHVFTAVIILSLATLTAQPRAEEIAPVSGKNTGPNTMSVLNSSQITPALMELNNMYRFLEANYLYDLDAKKVREGLAEGLMNSLGDEYSYYITSEDSEEYQEENNGTYVGIGTYLTKMNPAHADFSDPKTYMVQIISPFPGGPADRAGLKPGDLISHVNGEDISDYTDKEASKAIRGKAGEILTLTIHRGESVFDISLKPEVVTTPNISKGVLNGHIGYILIYSFNQQTRISFEDAYNELKVQGIDSLILDLRNNGGGIVETALQVADLFISDGTLLTVQYKEGSGNQPLRYVANTEIRIPKTMPTVVLINGGTASSSEILTAALKENGRATVIGSKSFGKGIMQSVMPFMDGYIQFTSAHYLTPDNNDIHKKGIEPDILVEEKEYSDAELKAYAEFASTDKTLEYVKANPGYTTENIEAFASLYEDSGVPQDILRLLARNEYIYSLDYDKRPVADTTYDIQLKRALEFIEKGV
jgi:C-terminal peptidase (prc)